MSIVIQAGAVQLQGDLEIPDGARGVVAFAHGTGSSRWSPRNRYVAGVLREAGLATLLTDLLTPEEEALEARTRHLRFDIPMLAGRLTAIVDHLAGRPDTRAMAIGLFGASTGAAAALVAAAERPAAVHAVVSRGGRPDLADAALAGVKSPVLLIVGALDDVVLDLNRAAAARLAAPHEMVVVPGAGHLFEEPGALEEVARRSAAWFAHHLI